MVFAEEESWYWKRSSDDMKSDILEWGDKEEEESEGDQVVEEEGVNAWWK